MAIWRRLVAVALHTHVVDSDAAARQSYSRAAFPNLSSIEKQTGFKDYVANVWNDLFAPTAIPKPIAEKLNAAVNRILIKPEVKQKVTEVGLTVVTGDANAAIEFVKRDAEKRKRIIKLVGLNRK